MLSESGHNLLWSPTFMDFDMGKFFGQRKCQHLVTMSIGGNYG